MKRYAVAGKTAATAATIDVGIAGIWNASSVRRIYVYEIHLFKQAVGAADEPKLRRTSARGTAATTATPTIENDFAQDQAPPSGALLDLSYSAQPTFTGTSGSGGDEISLVTPAAIGAGIMWAFPTPIEVKGGSGLAIVTGIALAFPVARVGYVWEE